MYRDTTNYAEYGDSDSVLADIYEKADDAMLAAKEEINPVDDPGEWSTVVAIALTRYRHFYNLGAATPNWEGYLAAVPGSNSDTDMALKCIDFPQIDMYKSMMFQIKVGYRDAGDFVDVTKSHLAEIRGIGDTVVAQHDTEDTYYWLSFQQLFGDFDNDILWVVFYLINDHPNLFSQGANHSRFRIIVRLSLIGYADAGVLAQYDWDLISDTVFERDLTYALLKLEDPTTDQDPPVHEPISLFETPILYDANRPARDINGESQTHEDYVPEWHIKMNSILMLDLEGNGVEYDYVGSGGTGVKKAEDFSSGEQADRQYDFILDMDTGASPGDVDDLAEAITNGLGSTWVFKVRAKDNASPPNYTAYSSTESVDISAAP